MTTPFKVKKSQKFHQLDVVKVDVVSPYMEHFKTNFYGIVAYSYAEKYSGDNNKSYSIIHLNKKLDKAISQSAWYEEADLTLSDKLSRENVEDILEDLEWISL